jgi:hypothetical protein
VFRQYFFCRQVYSTRWQPLLKNPVAMNIWKLILYLEISILAAALISACDLRSPAAPAQTAEEALASTVTLTPSMVPATLAHTPKPSPTPTSTPIPFPTLTLTKRPSPTPRPSRTQIPSITPTAQTQDFFDLRLSIIAKHGEKDYLIFHIIVRNSQAIPVSFQILDSETGQATNLFEFSVSPIPNLCAEEETVGWKYYTTDKIYFEDLPPDYWNRIWGGPFSYLINIEPSTAQEKSIILTDPPTSCLNIVE